MGCLSSKPETQDPLQPLPSVSTSSHLEPTGSNKRDPSGSTAEANLGLGFEPRPCTADELKKATANFSPDRSLGRGAFGEVWKGTLNWAPDAGDPSGFNVAVKKLFVEGDAQGHALWVSEAQKLLTLGNRHANIVSLLGYVYSDNLLVFPHYVNGSLLTALTGTRYVLTWPQRVSIAADCAKALQFLHAEKVMHRNVKPSNILLDAKFKAHLGDFGLAKEGSDGTFSHQSTAILGDLGYMDPEYYMMSRLTYKSDVYALGVVFLVLMAGRDDYTRDLRDWAVSPGALKSLEQKMDRKLKDEYDRDQAAKLLQLTTHCLHQEGARRPDMDDVAQKLEELCEGTSILTG